MLTILHHLPAGLLDVEPTNLHRVLDGPTLIHLPGRRRQPLFISTLLHGNETTSFYAMRSLLRRHADHQLPRALSLFIGNVAAASRGLRHLDDQPDYNRVWTDGSRPEHGMAQQVLAEMRDLQPFAAVDIHNTSGLNPYYACVNRLEQPFLHLATMFSRVVVYSVRPHTTLTRTFAEFCPAVILECGQPGTPHSVAHAVNYLEGCLHLSAFPAHPVPHQDIELLHTRAIVKIPEEIAFGFGDCEHALCFAPDMDRLNFQELPIGTPIARADDAPHALLSVTDQRGDLVTDEFFTLEDGEIRTICPVIPAMFTLDARIIRQDCLGYLMERMTPP